MLRLLLIFSLVFLTGCSIVPMKRDGFYVIEDVSSKGKTRKVHHFVTRNHMRSHAGTKMTNDELIEWYYSETSGEPNYSLLPTVVITRFNNNRGLRGHGKIPRHFAGSPRGSSFYKIKDGKIESVKPALPKKLKLEVYEVYSDEGELLFKGSYSSLSEIESGYYLARNDVGYSILNHEGEMVSDVYSWIGSRAYAPQYLMAFDGENFCVLTTTGKIQIPCVHADMVELLDYRYSVPNGNIHVLIDVDGVEIYRASFGEHILYDQPIPNIIAISTPDTPLNSYWSLVAEKRLDIQSRYASSVGLFKDLWSARFHEGLLVFDDHGQLIIPVALNNAGGKNGILIARDATDNTAFFRRDGVRISPVMKADISTVYGIPEDENTLFKYSVQRNKYGLVDQTMAVKTEASYSNIKYLGGGLYLLENGYSEPKDAFSLRAGLIQLQAKSISYFHDGVLIV